MDAERSAQVETGGTVATVERDRGGAEIPSSEESSSVRDDVRYLVAPITHVDVRDSSDSHGFWTMSGYAAVFDQKTTLYNGKFFKVTEEIDSHFFDAVLRDQPMREPEGVVHFNRGHDMNTSVAATDVPAGQPGSLQLKADEQGLFFLAKVPHDDPDGVALAAKMRSGVVRQASFAFTIAKEELRTTEMDDGPDEDHYTLLECKHLYDVCATPQGAYSQTVVGLRSLAAAVGQPFDGDPFTRQPVTGDEPDASPEEEAEGAPVTESEESPARAKLARTLELRETAASRFKSRKVTRA